MDHLYSIHVFKSTEYSRFNCRSAIDDLFTYFKQTKIKCDFLLSFDDLVEKFGRNNWAIW